MQRAGAEIEPVRSTSTGNRHTNIRHRARIRHGHRDIGYRLTLQREDERLGVRWRRLTARERSRGALVPGALEKRADLVVRRLLEVLVPEADGGERVRRERADDGVRFL